MAYKVNSLASATITHTFIALNGAIALAHEGASVIERPNVAGLDTMILPVKGRPFTLQSVASCTSETDAIAKYQAYTTLVAAGLVILTRNDVNYFTSYGQKAKVMGVALLDAQIAAIMTGNVSPGDSYLLTCSWLMTMEVP